MDAQMESLKSKAKEFGQEHIFNFWNDLNDDEKSILIKDVTEMDFAKIVKYFKIAQVCTQSTKKVDQDLEPLNSEVCGSVVESDDALLSSLEDEGLRAISANKVCVLLLAGGQGTRLGVTYPKGMYQVGLLSNKTLYQIQAERIQRVSQLAKEKFGGEAQITWYIMTSEHTQEATQTFFKEHNYFGLSPQNVVFFEQYTLPAISKDGKIILEKHHKIAKAPDGNGGLYRALRERGILDDMKSRGVHYVHVYCVDNILVRMADPRFLGFCLLKKAECGAKVVEKKLPEESVGVVGLVKGRYQVVEYSEISKETAQMRLPDDGRLVYRSGNICNHFFTIDFLSRVTSEEYEEQLVHHLANKKVPYVDDSGNIVIPSVPNAIKMEKFVFDVFPFANNMAVWEVVREDEFSPLKNAPGSKQDSPEVCRDALYRYHRRLLEAAGARFNSDASNGSLHGDLHGGLKNGVDVSEETVRPIEISPLVSYDGEGLHAIVNDLIIEKYNVHLERNHDGKVIFNDS